MAPSRGAQTGRRWSSRNCHTVAGWGNVVEESCESLQWLCISPWCVVCVCVSLRGFLIRACNPVPPPSQGHAVGRAAEELLERCCNAGKGAKQAGTLVCSDLHGITGSRNVVSLILICFSLPWSSGAMSQVPKIGLA